ncbi:dihydrofolate reductase family protein [Paraflavitalea sp. CAU 1676]|uniref:dihydrofolate reductase family protein n=1 Tax=Paraflavitalea sp. CAU 1676 TaxID=3032598 RepID=UPI0023D9F979|nr:dihydrofolate reductase family protein [Paraflavitalea sp. CAU 1676]MDF2193573.1 dihydrofolate reductase family protein [Paraflavitalea sp. CAU 1676]
MKRQVVLFIAMSIDGYIAKDEDNIDFLSIVDRPGEDYGYLDFQQSVDTVIWGRKTYDKLLSFGVEFPHKDKKVYVLSRSKTGADENVQYFNAPIKDLIALIREQPGKHIYCDGGGEVVFELLKEKLIDKMVISVIPHLVGNGVRLFKDGRPDQELTLLRSISYPSGLVQLWYDVKG